MWSPGGGRGAPHRSRCVAARPYARTSWEGMLRMVQARTFGERYCNRFAKSTKCAPAKSISPILMRPDENDLYRMSSIFRRLANCASSLRKLSSYSRLNSLSILSSSYSCADAMSSIDPVMLCFFHRIICFHCSNNLI
jgi:hypothetical protein